ncbi:MAG: hypothetical protein RSA49_05055 [Anaerovoracaceae bacterium]
MGNKPLVKMRRKDRAKQFAPFSALKGLEEALEYRVFVRETESYKEGQVCEEILEEYNHLEE